jgi:excisionase family DNA binding protein
MNDQIQSPVSNRPDRTSRSECLGRDGLSDSSARQNVRAVQATAPDAFGPDSSTSLLPPAIPSGRASLASALQPLLTIEQVADLLQVSEKTVRRLMLSKRLPHVRLGRVVRFRQDELLRWIEARKEV